MESIMSALYASGLPKSLHDKLDMISQTVSKSDPAQLVLGNIKLRQRVIALEEDAARAYDHGTRLQDACITSRQNSTRLQQGVKPALLRGIWKREVELARA